MNDTISKQAAIDAIKRAIWDKHTAKDAIDAVCNVPSAQPVDKDTNVPTNDIISRQAVKEWLYRWEGYIDKDMIARMQYRVIDIPSAERKKGEWMRLGEYPDGESLKCSECGVVLEDWVMGAFFNYCPNCGADMRGEADV